MRILSIMTQHNETQHNGINHIDTQHFEITIKNVTRSITKLSTTTLVTVLCSVSFMLNAANKPIMQSAVMLNVNMLSVVAPSQLTALHALRDGYVLIM